jgi:hypothetical protein
MKIVVHAVHGTWPYGLWAQMLKKRSQKIGGARPWFLEDSSFQIELAKLTGRTLTWVPFEWNGKNSFSARASAAVALSQHLIDWFQREPEAEHVVIAHSHGGSVAVAAACVLDDCIPNQLTKVITLATPFAQERLSQRDSRQLKARYLALRFGWLPIVLFSACAALISSGSDTPFLGRLILPLIGFKAFGAYVFAMYLVVFAAFLVKGWAIKLEPSFANLMILPPAKQGSWSLYAIRAPQDEATIAINTSQFIDFVSNLLFTRCLIAPFEWIRPKSVLFGVLLLPFAILASFLPMNFGILVVLTLIVIGQFLVAVFPVVALVGSLILIPANIVLAGALGAEVLRVHRGLVEVECEPIPSGITGMVSTIKLSEAERSQLALVHYIHAAHAARSRVADILKLPTTSSKT